jgi:hypothetical protein
MEMKQFLDQLGHLDMESWILVQKAYKEFASDEDIMDCGFNPRSGYVWIALENGIQIVSTLGHSVEYITEDPQTYEELFFDTYQEALDYIYLVQ